MMTSMLMIPSSGQAIMASGSGLQSSGSSQYGTVPVRVVYGANQYGSSSSQYGNGYGRQQTVQTVTQTRPLAYGRVMGVGSSAVMPQTVQRIQTTRVEQVRQLPVQITG